MIPDELAGAIREGDRRALARGITLVESTREDHRRQAEALLQLLAPHAGGALRIGISGVPGAGKSTFIEAIGGRIIDRGHRLAILAVDPSSSVTGGSILGDKTRMELLSRRREAFIRPSPASGSLGGVARRTRESMLLCEAAGFDRVLVETVGVGQSETAVADMTDMFLLLLIPGSGDELQGIKRGIMELADLIIINKADGELANAARHSAADCLAALKLLHPRTPGWRVPVQPCSSLHGEGIDEVLSRIDGYRQFIETGGELERRRHAQARAWMWSEVSDSLITALRSDPQVRALLPELERQVVAGTLPPAVAAARLLESFLQRSDNQPSRERT